MNAYSLFLGFLPLILFVVIDSFLGLRAGVFAAILFAIAEVCYSLIVYHTLDGLTLGSTLLILFFGLWSLRSNHPIYMKLQPVVLGFVFGFAFVVMQMLGKPLLVIMVEKYQYMLPEEYRHVILQPAYLAMLARLSTVLGVGFFVHASFVLYAAFFLNKWWWLFIRGIGLYIMMFACVGYVRFT